MSQIATLRPWAFVLIAIWFILWGICKLFKVNNPVVEGILAVLAIVAGGLLLLSS